MPEQTKQGNEMTKEQLSDVYAAGTSDGIMETESGLIQVDDQGRVKDLKDQADDNDI